MRVLKDQGAYWKQFLTHPMCIKWVMHVYIWGTIIEVRVWAKGNKRKQHDKMIITPIIGIRKTQPPCWDSESWSWSWKSTDIPHVDQSFYKKHQPLEKNTGHANFLKDLVKFDLLTLWFTTYGKQPWMRMNVLFQTYPNSIKEEKSLHWQVTGDYLSKRLYIYIYCNETHFSQPAKNKTYHNTSKWQNTRHHVHLPPKKIHIYISLYIYTLYMASTH